MAISKCFRSFANFSSGLGSAHSVCRCQLGPMDPLMDLRFDAKGLKEDWDTNPYLRSRIRDGLPFLSGTIGDFSVQRCVHNLEALTPVLVRSAACDHRRPEVDHFREQISDLLSMNSRPPVESDIDDWAWDLRKLLAFIKRKSKREEVSTVSWQAI